MFTELYCYIVNNQISILCLHKLSAFFYLKRSRGVTNVHVIPEVSRRAGAHLLDAEQNRVLKV